MSDPAVARFVIHRAADRQLTARARRPRGRPRARAGGPTWRPAGSTTATRRPAALGVACGTGSTGIRAAGPSPQTAQRSGGAAASDHRAAATDRVEPRLPVTFPTASGAAAPVRTTPSAAGTCTVAPAIDIGSSVPAGGWRWRQIGRRPLAADRLARRSARRRGRWRPPILRPRRGAPLADPDSEPQRPSHRARQQPAPTAAVVRPPARPAVQGCAPASAQAAPRPSGSAGAAVRSQSTDAAGFLPGRGRDRAESARARSGRREVRLPTTRTGPGAGVPGCRPVERRARDEKKTCPPSPPRPTVRPRSAGRRRTRRSRSRPAPQRGQAPRPERDADRPTRGRPRQDQRDHSGAAGLRADAADFDGPRSAVRPGRAARTVRHRHPVPHPDRNDPGRAGRPRRTRPRPDRVGQDAGLRAAHDHHAVRRRQPGRHVRPAAWSWCPPASWPCRSPTCWRRWPARAGLAVVLVAGGMSYTPQLRALQRGVDIVVATPGRLIDLFEQGAVDLGRVESHRAGRGRPHGRPGLHARGHPAPRRGSARRPAAAVLGHPGRCGRPAGHAAT